MNITRAIQTLETVDAKNKRTISATISRYTTDSNGVVLAGGAIPASEKKPFPFHLFGDFDRVSGYAIADNLVNKQFNTLLFGVYVWGVNTPLFYFTGGIATINNYMKKGDIVFIYVDDLQAPNYFTFIVISANQGGFASMVAQSNISQLDASGNWGVFQLDGLKYTWTNDDQLQHPVYLIRTYPNGSNVSNPINPQAYYNPQDQKNNVHTTILPITAIVNQYFGITGFLDYNNPVLNLVFTFHV